ncbi:hypothetical protein HY988_02450 [Candidatus Micrarchaeota archaeon]|nr:hypothetical protein [Candidatus Micrarchaeota archaeon]
MEEQKKYDGVSVSGVLQSVSIALDGYDDIFSDFDPSPYAIRLMSEDFLRELKRHYTENRHGDFVITFTLPKSLRSEKTENLIRKRIKDHFTSSLSKLRKETYKARREGILRIGGGMAIAALVFTVPQFETQLPLMILSTLSWYFLWSGYEKFFEAPSAMNKKERFFDKFVSAKYNFVDQEDVVKSINIGSSYR